MAEKCLKCFRPLHTCYCRYITPVDPDIKFVILMHPHEAYKQKTGTGRLTALSLVGTEIIIDETFDNNRKVKNFIADPSYFPMLLYPGERAFTAGTFNFHDYLANKKLLIFLIDGTWSMARKMVYRSKTLQALPCLTFSRKYRSMFSIKTQPAAYCLSTIESVYYLIGELQETGICNPAVNPEGLIKIFKLMVEFQIDCQKNNS